MSPFTDARASAPAFHSAALKLCHPLAFCGQAMPATLPRFRNCCCLTIASKSKLLSALQGVQPMGNTPARGLPFGDSAAGVAAPGLAAPAHESTPSAQPAPFRNFRRFPATVLSARRTIGPPAYHGSNPRRGRSCSSSQAVRIAGKYEIRPPHAATERSIMAGPCVMPGRCAL